MVIKSPLSADVVNQLLKLRYINKYLVLLTACDKETKKHSIRVAKIAGDLGIELGLPLNDTKTLCLAGLLHDVGKCDIDSKLLHKKRFFTAHDRKKMSKHTVFGVDKIKEKRLKVVKEIVLHHHDFNAKGRHKNQTVKRRRGSVPYLTEIVAAADMFDALQSKRPYKLPFGKMRIERIMRSEFYGNSSLIPKVLERY